MTEYELGELLHNNYDGLWQSAQMYFTLVSAYIVVAYLVGQKLTRVQIGIITGLYLVWVIGITQAHYSTSVQMIQVSDSLLAIGSDILPRAVRDQTRAGVYSFALVQVLGIIASLYFMWSVRHPKTE